MTNLPHSQEDMSASDAPTSQSLEELFGEPISVYTDADAVEDGFIVDLAKFTNVRFLGLPINRMTRHLYDDLEPFAKTEAETLYDGSIGRALASVLSTKIGFANGDPGNTGEIGDIYTIPRSCGLSVTKSAAGPPCTRKTTNRVAKSESGRNLPLSFIFARDNGLSSGRLDLLNRLLGKPRPRFLLLRFLQPFLPQLCPTCPLRHSHPLACSCGYRSRSSLRPSLLQLRPPRALGRCDLGSPRGRHLPPRSSHMGRASRPRGPAQMITPNQTLHNQNRLIQPFHFALRATSFLPQFVQCTRQICHEVPFLTEELNS
jgi:hypothetical protein